MYLSAERLALANQTICETFEQCSVAWQAIPHWDTGDPGQSRVRSGVVDTPASVPVVLAYEAFEVTLVQTTAPNPDALMDEVMVATTKLAAKFDTVVLVPIDTAAVANAIPPFNAPVGAPDQKLLLNALIDARAKVEDAGYRAPSCLLTNTLGLKGLSALDAGYPITESLLDSVYVNSLHRTSLLNADAAANKPDGTPALDQGKPILKPAPRMVMIGRRQLIPHRGAPDASPGEEPVDLAVSVLPSLELVGEVADSKLEFSVRIRFALRIKDPKSLVAVVGTPVVP